MSPAGSVTTGVPFSWNPFDDVQTLLQFQFMRNAYVAGSAAAIVGGVVGYLAVVRGLTFAAHTLSQIGFAGATGAVMVGITPLYGLLAVNGIGALCIGVAGRDLRSRDAVTGMVQTAALGCGLLFLALSRARAAVPVLVGDVYAVSPLEVTLTVVVALGILAIAVVIWRPLVFASMDADLARARGVPVAMLSVAFLLLLAVATSVATPIVGVLLTFSLLVGPAATADIMASRPSRAVALSVALALTYMWSGLAVSYWVDFPPSVFITGLAFAAYVVARLVRTLGRRRW